MILLISILWISEISAFLRLPVNVNEIGKIDVKVTEGTRSRRSVDGLLHPTSYDLDLNVEGSDVHIHLTRNEQLVSNVPTLSLQKGVLTKLYLQDQEETIFFQDTKCGAAFVIQKNEDQVQNMFGIFHSEGNEYTLQSSNKSSSFTEGTNRFDIVRGKRTEIEYGDIIGEGTERLKNRTRHRHKRATGSNQIELLIVCDYAVYKYWYDQSDKLTVNEKTEDAEKSVRQYYAFVINGMDAMYKNIQTSSYTISVVYAGIVISKTQSDATWTETIKSTTNTVSADIGLENFQTWVRNNINSLPGNDHSMLFTRYDLTYRGSTAVAGLAWTSAICGSSSQSIVEDGFNFIMITTAAHELGHSLSAAHDGTGNNCLSSDAYIMSPSNSPQSNTITATNPWRFSSCSTNYFTNMIDKLESTNQNCMKIRSSTFDPTAQSPYNQQLAGQIYDADAQCKQIHGSSSFMCRDQYNNDYSEICNILWCKNPGSGFCTSVIAGEGTLCGSNKWCISGTCTADSRAPSGNDACLYGDVKGSVFSNGWTCADMAAIAPNNCLTSSESCCYSCNVQNPTTTTTSTTPSTSTTTTATTTSSTSRTTTLTTTTTSTTPPISSTTNSIEATTTTSTTPPISSTTNSTEATIDLQKLIKIGAGAAVGALVVIVTIVIIVVMCWRKGSEPKKQKNVRSHQNQDHPYVIGYDNRGMLPDYINTKPRY